VALIRDNRPAVVGGVVVVISTCALFVLSVFVPSGEIKLFVFKQTNTWLFGDPATPLRYLGGIPGGFVAGYLARDYWGRDEWGAAMKAGVYAALFGLGAIYVGLVTYNLVRSVMVAGMFPPPLYIIAVVPLIFGIPLIFVYTVEALLAAAIGNACSRIVRDSESVAVEGR
jgi:hypothetical protein